MKSVLIIGSLEDEFFPLYLGSSPQLELFSLYQRATISLCKVLKSMSIHVVYRHPSLSKNWLYDLPRKIYLLPIIIRHAVTKLKIFHLLFAIIIILPWECVETKIPVKP